MSWWSRDLRESPHRALREPEEQGRLDDHELAGDDVVEDEGAVVQRHSDLTVPELGTDRVAGQIDLLGSQAGVVTLPGGLGGTSMRALPAGRR